MFINKMSFSAPTIEAFRDYMYHYCAETLKRKNFTYDNTKDFATKEALVSKTILKDIENISGVSFSNENISIGTLAFHPNVKFATFAVIGELIDAIIPSVLDKSIGIYTDIRNGAFGDSFRFDVESTDLFTVSLAGRGHRMAESQTHYKGTRYVTPVNHMITVETSLFKILVENGKGLAELAMKAILSVEAQMAKEAYTLFNTAAAALPSDATTGLQITASNSQVAKADALKLASKVQAYNNNNPVYFVGTKAALSRLNPDSTNDNFRYSDASVAYFLNIWGVDTLELPQIADYKNPYSVYLNDSRIYVISPNSQKILKLCLEGQTLMLEQEAKSNADKSIITTMEKSWGLANISNAKMGLINF